MRLITAFSRDTRGAAAVELSLISPFIAGLALVSVGVWDVGMRKEDMRGAVQLAVQYYMNGGQSDSTAASLGLAAWKRRPENSTLTVTRTFRCGLQEVESTTLCDDGRAPAVFIAVNAAASTQGAIISPSQTLREEVRVR